MGEGRGGGNCRSGNELAAAGVVHNGEKTCRNAEVKRGHHRAANDSPVDQQTAVAV